MFIFMKELNDIIFAHDKAVAQNRKTALATVVRVEGSSYRRPGARMLVTEDVATIDFPKGGIDIDTQKDYESLLNL